MKNKELSNMGARRKAQGERVGHKTHGTFNRLALTINTKSFTFR
jgi:hypothetical protein